MDATNYRDPYVVHPHICTADAASHAVKAVSIYDLIQGTTTKQGGDTSDNDWAYCFVPLLQQTTFPPVQ